MRFFRKSLKTKLITFSILLVTIPLLILSTFSYYNSKESLDELGNANLKNAVSLTIEMIDGLNIEVNKGNLYKEDAQERVKSSIIGVKNEDGTREMTNALDLGENGFMFVLDMHGNIVAHPTLEGQNLIDAKDPNGVKYIQKLLEVGDQEEGGTFSYDAPLPGKENEFGKMVTYAQAEPDWGWTVVAGTYASDFNQSANDMMIANAIVTWSTILVSIFIVWFIANRIAKPIKTVSARMNQLANGDLDGEEVSVKSKDEIGDLATSLNRMQHNLKDMIQNVSSASETINSQSTELTRYAEEVASGSEQIAITMEEISKGSEEQATASSELNETMGRFVNEIAEVAFTGENTKNNAENMLQMANDGSRYMESSVSKMDVINDKMQQSLEMVKGLDSKTKEISTIMAVITDIAEQTNLLALNAAIEAARAGEHGRGFAVVADEVRKLSEEVSNSTSGIIEIVNEIQKESQQVVQSLDEGYHLVEDGSEQIQTTGQTFHSLKQVINEVGEQVETMSASLFKVIDDSKTINQSIENIASISEESAAGVEQVSATA
ncbi:methyl-accepting chemotaxis protein [Salirhabdus sp. Marseille-P4669]|uniref:methyl-accepting chemotaxis protein n=1 Tax=Salirhabdus sp. Marseille-P4669 TaxID=2042310 RepID=UPI001F3C3BE6|nr:methyl-accepting chemotaxis protein [Salirhabdus sp. Marseille-P4669]